MDAPTEKGAVVLRQLLFSYIPCDEFFEWFVWPLEGDIRFFCQVIQGKAQAGSSAVGQAVFVEVEFRRVVIGTAAFFLLFSMPVKIRTPGRAGP